MNEEFKRHLEILQKKDAHYLGLNWKNSAAFFKKEAEAGRDISAAADALKNVFYESAQVPVMDEVSAALIYQSINDSDFSDLDGLIQNTAYPDFIFSVFLTVAENKDHLEPAVPFLLSCFAEKKDPALPILKEIIRKSSDREKLIGESADFFLKKKKKLLPGFLKSLAGSKISINSEIHRLNDFFRSEKDLSILSESLSAIAESGADLSPLEENLVSLLKKRKKTHRRIFSRCICIHWIYRDQKDNLEKMISDRSSDVRYGSCSSIIFSLYRNPSSQYFLEKLLIFLWDSEEEIRKTAVNRLRIFESENPEYILKVTQLKELIQKSPKISTELFDLLLFFAGTTVKNAESVLDISFLLNHPEKGKLAELCISKVSGTETCRICLAIPRNKLYYWDFEVPKEILRLVPEMDFTEETPGCRRICPVCGRRYHYRFITEYEDMSSSTEIRIEKLPPEFSELPEEKEYLDQFLAVLHREMTHPEPKVRENAGFDLSVYYYLTEDYQNLFSLLRNSQDIPVQKGALKGISGRKLSEELVSVLSELLKSPDSGIRSNIAEELSGYYMQTENIEGIKNLLSASDHIFTVSPSIQKVFFSVKKVQCIWIFYIQHS